MPETRDPQGQDPSGFLEKLLSFVPVGFQALMTGDTPADRTLRAGAARAKDEGAGVPMPDVIRGLIEGSQGPAGQALGMLVPGVPGGPIFKSGRDLLRGVEKMPTEKLTLLDSDARHSIRGVTTDPKGAKAPPTGKIPSSEGGHMSRQQAELFALSDATNTELARRAVNGDSRAYSYLKSYMDPDDLADMGFAKDEILNTIYYSGRDSERFLQELEPFIQLFETLTDMAAKGFKP